MLPHNEPLKSWFGHTRRERRANAVLLMIILSVLLIRYLLPDRKTVIRELALEGYDTIILPVSFPAETAGMERPGIRRQPYARRSFPVRHPDPARDTGTDHAAGGMQQKPLVNLNTCDSSELVTLPGIGPVLSSRIIKYRNMLGGFAVPEQLKEVYGLPEETFNVISSMVCADTAGIRKIPVNTADYRGLLRIPYIEKYEVTAILKYRELRGSITGTDDLVENGLVSADKAAKICPYLVFR